MKKVLIISYTFPPVGGAGVQRVSKFVKYLPATGWAPTILTTSNASVPLIDRNLLKDIPDSVQVIRTKTLEPSYAVKSQVKELDKNTNILGKIKILIRNIVKALLFPDAQILWWLHTSFALRKLLRTRDFEVIFVTGPPFSAILCTVFWGRFYKVPVVVDFRDEWSFSRQNWENSAKNKVSLWLDSQCEKWVISRAAAITVASPGYKLSFEKKYPELSKKNICFFIPNGFDHEDYLGKEDCVANLKFQFKNKFILLYAGTLWKATSIKNVALAIESMLARNPKLAAKFQLRIVGRVVEEELEALNTLVDLGVAKVEGYLGHDDVITEMLSSDALLLTLSDLDGAEKIIPGKLFEYLATNLPILAVLPNGVCSNLLAEINPDGICFPSNIDDISKHLENLIWVKSDKFSSGESVNRYRRDFLTSELAAVFNDLGFH